MESLAQLRARATGREGAYRAWPKNLWGVELEVADFLWGLVRVLHPALVLESGTGIGLSSRCMAHALREIGVGRLVTFEPSPEIRAAAVGRLKGLPVELRAGDTLGWDGPLPDLVFLDSYPRDRRAKEMEHWLARPVLVAIHDSRRYQLPPGIEMPTPRGLWLGRGGA
jgi:predicted O-methyltransferase YrrM